MEGQLLPDERAFLYNAVIERKPSIVLEVGTWKGGGSTLQIASALASNNKGVLYTCEVDPALYTEAVNNYSSSRFRDYVKFHNKPSTILIESMIKNNNIPDFVFFDGPEDSDLNINDFKLLDQYLPSGSYFCMHDWDLGHRHDGISSSKATLLRPYLEQLTTWKIIRSLTAPISVGIVLAIKTA